MKEEEHCDTWSRGRRAKRVKKETKNNTEKRPPSSRVMTRRMRRKQIDK